jgi:hypothetical protein
MKTLFAALVCVASLAAPAAAGLSDVSVEPAVPVVGDVAAITATGWLPDPCWALVDQHLKRIERTLEVELWTAHVAPPDVGCIAVIVPFSSEARHVFSEPGAWTIRVIEHPRGPVGPLPDIVLETTVTVAGSAPAGQLTWSTLKAKYR